MVIPMQGAMAMTAEEALFGNGTANVTPEPAAVEETAEPGQTVAPTAEAPSEYPTLEKGDRDKDGETAYVEMLQNRLIALGFLKDSADGAFGENTRTAVEQFQKLNNLERTGVADHDTQVLLYSDMSQLVTPSPEDNVAFGAEAIRVQTKLIEWGFLRGSADGKLGKKSAEAIADFKQYMYAHMDANPTPTPTPEPTPAPTPTLAPGEMPCVVDVPIATPEPTPTPRNTDGEVNDFVLSYVDGDEYFPIYNQTVQNGDKNADVVRVQNRLNQLNYLYIHRDADGVFGLNTARALMYFQRKHGLTETGIADEATQRALFSAGAQKSEEYVFPYKLGVSRGEQCVYVVAWDGSGYNNQVNRMICSTGRDDTPTPAGTYQAYGSIDGEWHYFEDFNCYAKWAYGIIGDVLFHSVTFDANKNLNEGSVRYLGRKASHGCVRLQIEDAKWIVDNCPVGTTVVIW